MREPPRGLALMLARIVLYGVVGMLIGGGLTWLGPLVIDQTVQWRVVQLLILGMPGR